MIRKFCSLCCFILAITLMAGQSKAGLLLSVRGPGGSESAVINLGDEITLEISVQVTELPYTVANPSWPLSGPETYTFSNVRLSGGDFLIGTGSANSFGAAEALSGGNIFEPGVWSPSPPEGQVTRFWTAGPTTDSDLTQVGESLTFARIVLRGEVLGSNFTTELSQFVFLEGRQFTEIPMTTSNFSYSVVPEPSSVMLVGTAICGLAFRRRRQ